MWTPEQQAQHRELWKEALLSGDFKQGKNYLCSDGKYCCLGVACEVYIREGNTLRTEGGSFTQKLYDGGKFYLPDVVIRWLGLKDNEGEFKFGSRYNSLAQMNDKGLTFAEIVAEFPNLLLSNAEGL